MKVCAGRGLFSRLTTFCRISGGCGGGLRPRSIFSAKSSKDSRNSTPRNRSRTTGVVNRGFRISSGSHISAESPKDFATSQGQNSSGTINVVVSEMPFFDQSSPKCCCFNCWVLARLKRQVRLLLCKILERCLLRAPWKLSVSETQTSCHLLPKVRQNADLRQGQFWSSRASASEWLILRTTCTWKW